MVEPCTLDQDVLWGQTLDIAIHQEKGVGRPWDVQAVPGGTVVVLICWAGPHREAAFVRTAQ